MLCSAAIAIDSRLLLFTLVWLTS